MEWYVQPGAVVKPGDRLYALETDKAVIEVEAEEGGTLGKIIVSRGGTAPVKSPVAYYGPSESAVDAFLGGPISDASSAPTTPAPVADAPAASVPTSASSSEPTSAERVKASPAARNAATHHGVELSACFPGSGPDGRVLVEDVERAAAAKPAATVSAPATPAAPVTSAIGAHAGGKRQPLTKMRRAIARNLQLSKQTLPHWYIKRTIDAEPLQAFYRREKALYPCSLNDVIVYACGRAIVEFPEFRSQIDGDDLVAFDAVNIGLAVGLDAGLVVPVVSGVETRSLKGIAQETRRVIEAARGGKLEGAGTGVFTISNLGMFEVDEFAAIINPPEAGILAVGAVREAVVVHQGSMRAGKVMTLTLSADHRVIDGVLAAKFMARLVDLLTDPSRIAGGV